ncbi:MAG: hypothetical protein K2K66_03225 [Ruminococcus sp.]|nr:hypothetical protein [Ruminococcus sp.]
MEHDITLNIHYTIPENLWKKLIPLIEELDVYGIEYSVEVGGLQLFEEGNIPDKEWNRLINRFCKQASEILGFAVGDACGDFECVPFT